MATVDTSFLGSVQRPFLTAFSDLPFVEQVERAALTLTGLENGEMPFFKEALSIASALDFPLCFEPSPDSKYVSEVVAPQFRFFANNKLYSPWEGRLHSAYETNNSEMALEYIAAGAIAVQSGLFTYSDVTGEVQHLHDLLEEQIKGIPSPSKKNKFYSKGAVALRGVGYFLIGALAVRNLGALGLSVPLGIKVLTETPIFFANRKHNKKVAIAAQQYQSAIGRTRAMTEALGGHVSKMTPFEDNETNPSSISPDRWEWRQAYFNSKGITNLTVIRSAQDVFDHKPLMLGHSRKYVCVELPEGGFEVRILRGESFYGSGTEVYHADFFLPDRGEKMVGAGRVIFDQEGMKLKPDGTSSGFITFEGEIFCENPKHASNTQGMLMVRRIFQDIVGGKITVGY